MRVDSSSRPTGYVNDAGHILFYLKVLLAASPAILKLPLPNSDEQLVRKDGSDVSRCAEWPHTYQSAGDQQRLRSSLSAPAYTE